jgi:3-dehydroquinate dehydratase-2
MIIEVINGPNLNLLGTRETQIYGDKKLKDVENLLKLNFPSIQFHFRQTNHEGEFIDIIQNCIQSHHPVIINPGGYSHTSVAIHDALVNLKSPKIEVHISNIYQRETFRHHSITAMACDGVIAGLGINGYRLAVEAILLLLSEGSDATV